MLQEQYQPKAGINTLVFKALNHQTDWIGSVWISDAEGKPFPGLSVTLDRDGRE